MRFVCYGSFEPFRIDDDSLTLAYIRKTLSDYFPELKHMPCVQIGKRIVFGNDYHQHFSEPVRPVPYVQPRRSFYSLPTTSARVGKFIRREVLLLS